MKKRGNRVYSLPLSSSSFSLFISFSPCPSPTQYILIIHLLNYLLYLLLSFFSTFFIPHFSRFLIIFSFLLFSFSSVLHLAILFHFSIPLLLFSLSSFFPLSIILHPLPSLTIPLFQLFLSFYLPLPHLPPSVISSFYPSLSSSCVISPLPSFPHLPPPAFLSS